MKSVIQPVVDECALFIPQGELLVVADLHIGIEVELRDHGLHTPSQTKLLLSRLRKLLDVYHPQDLVLLGDIKHTIPAAPWQERRDITQFFSELSTRVRVHVVPGNHDGNIDRLILGDIQVHSSAGMVVGDVGLSHGHRWPDMQVMSCRYVVMGHTHPTVLLQDRLGYKVFEPCWLRGRFKPAVLRERYKLQQSPEVVVLPAFNPLCGGIAVNKEPLVGPLGKSIRIATARVFLVDGTELGLVKDINLSS